MRKFTDQTGRTIYVPDSPQRVISLVPSQTELLYDLGVGVHLKGITKFCVHPRHLKKETIIVGGTKNIRYNSIKSINPDLIIANKEENNKEDVLKLESDYPVWVSDIKDVDDALEMINSVAELINKQYEARSLVNEIVLERNRYQPESTSKSAIYLIWKDPYMASGNDTFINSMLFEAGLKNLIQQPRYPEISIEQIQEMNPDYLLLSSEPYPFKEEHLKDLQPVLPNTKLIIVDGEMFSWYGSRMRMSWKYFAEVMQ